MIVSIIIYNLGLKWDLVINQTSYNCAKLRCSSLCCMRIQFLTPLNNPLFKNMPHVGSFWHFVICCICVFVYVYFVFACLTHGNIIFDTLEQSPFQKYATCWVFLAPHNMLCMCICVFCYCICLFLCICHHHMIEEIILFTAIFQMRCLT